MPTGFLLFLNDLEYIMQHTFYYITSNKCLHETMFTFINYKHIYTRIEFYYTFHFSLRSNKTYIYIAVNKPIGTGKFNFARWKDLYAICALINETVLQRRELHVL